MTVRMFYGDYEFTPVPLFSWGQEIVRDPKLEEVALRNTLDFTGTLLELTGESGAFDTLMDKREQLFSALASGNQEFIITSSDIPVVSGVFPKVLDVEAVEGVWTDQIDYTFSMQYDEDFFNTGIQSFTENWSFEEDDNRLTATVNHNISAVGLNTAGSGLNNSLTNARTFVLARTGYSNVVDGHPAFVQVSGTFIAFEGLRTENVDVANGSMDISETFVLSSGTYIHEQNASYDLSDEGIVTINLDGNLQGLGRSDAGFDNALTGWNTIKGNLPGNASGVYGRYGGEGTLFTTNFDQFSITQNPFPGTIGYNVSYTDDPTENLPSGIQEFDITKNDTNAVRLFATFPIAERSLGNVVQDIATSTEGQINITGSVVGKQGFPFASVVAFAEDQINLIRPLAVDFITLRLSTQNINRDELKNTITFTLGWTYTVELSQVPVEGPVSL